MARPWWRPDVPVEFGVSGVSGLIQSRDSCVQSPAWSQLSGLSIACWSSDWLSLKPELAEAGARSKLRIVFTGDGTSDRSGPAEEASLVDV